MFLAVLLGGVAVVVAKNGFKAKGVSDVGVDADALDDAAVLADIDGGGAQDAAGLGVGDIVELVAVVLGAAHDGQAQVAAAAADGAAGDVAVSDIDDGVLIGAGQVVVDDFARGAQMRLQEVEDLFDGDHGFLFVGGFPGGIWNEIFVLHKRRSLLRFSLVLTNCFLL